MDEAGIKESRVICENSQGLKISGTIIHLGRDEVIFEVYSPAAVIQICEALREFKVQLQDRIAYAGRAVVKNLVQSELKFVCTVALDDSWQMQFTAAELQPGQMQGLLKEHLRQWQKLYLIRAEYKLHIADMETFFADVKTVVGPGPSSPRNSWHDRMEASWQLGSP